MSKNLFKPLIKKNIKYTQFNQFFLYCTHNNNEIKSSPKTRMKVEGTSYETEIWKTISWQDIAIAALFWRRFLSSMQISKSVSVYAFNLLNLLQKSILCQIYYDDVELFWRMVDQRKAFTPYFQPRPLSQILIITNFQHAASRVWSCAESEFRFCWMKLCSSDNNYTTL